MWYVIQVTAGTEISASEKCRRAFPERSCLRVFVPRYICLRKYQGQWKEESRVLFPGYFFVDADDGSEIGQVLHAALTRFAAPVCVESDFVPIYPEEQAFLNSLFDENGTVQMSRGDIIGGSFDIRQGPLQKKEDRIRRIDRHKRMAEIELSIHGEKRRVRVGLEIVNKQLC